MLQLVRDNHIRFTIDQQPYVQGFYPVVALTLKLRYADFQTLTRARSVNGRVNGRELFTGIGQDLLDELMPLPQPVRLMGLTLSALEKEGAADERSPGSAQLSLL